MAEFSPALQKQKKRVFVSATPSDLASMRRVLLDALWDSGCEPVEVPDYPRYWRTADRLFRDTLGSCDAIIHVAGMAYGTEPELPTKPPGEPRQSFVQMENRIGQELYEDPRSRLKELHILIAAEDFDFDALPAAEPEVLRDLQARHRSTLGELPDAQRLTHTGELVASVKAWFFEAPPPDCAEEKKEKPAPPKARQSPFKMLEAALAVVVGLGVIGWGVMKLSQQRSGGTPQISAAQSQTAVPADQLIPVYIERFRLWRRISPQLPNPTVDQLVRADLAQQFTVSESSIAQGISSGASSRTGTATPLSERLPALFVAGRHQSLIELASLNKASLDTEAYRLLGDSAKALNDEKPQATQQERMVEYYRLAAAGFKDQSPEKWAECQTEQALAMVALQGITPEVRTLLEEVLAVQQKKPSAVLPYVLVSLAQVINEDDPQKARAFIQQAETLLKEPKNLSGTAELAMCLATSAFIGERKDIRLTAENDLRESLSLLTSKFGPDHPILCPVLARIAAHLQQPNLYSSTTSSNTTLGRFGKAMQKSHQEEIEKLLRQVLTTTEYARGPSHPQVGIPLEKIGNFMLDEERYAEAEAFFHRRLEIYKAAFSPNDDKTFLAKADQAIALLFLKRSQEAEPLLKQVLVHFESNSAMFRNEIAAILWHLSVALVSLNRSQEAIPHLRRGLDLQEKHSGKTSITVVPFLTELASASYFNYGFAEGEGVARRALKLVFEFNAASASDPHPLTPQIIRLYGLNSSRNGQSLEQAQERVKTMAAEYGLPPAQVKEWIRKAFDEAEWR